MGNWLKYRKCEEGAGGDPGGNNDPVIDPPPSDPPADPPPADPPADPDPAKGYWPDDWQSRLSKGDDKLAKQFGRFAS